MLIKRSVITAVLAFGAIVFGFVLLIRGCLSKYDERSAVSPVLYFEKPGGEIIFSIVKFEKTTSYSQKNGMTHRSVSTSYYIQTNDAVTGEKKLSQKVKKHKQVKQHPVEIMGSSKGLAWVFLGEPMAFDPFTLEKKADLEMLEAQNPQMNGIFPAERRYYRFDQDQQAIFITGIDGSIWRMDASTGKAEPSTESEETDPVKKESERIAQLEKENRDKQDSLYQQKNRKAVEQYTRKEINAETYQRLTKIYYKERDQLYRERDSLQKLKSKLSQEESNYRDLFRALEQLRGPSKSFSSIKYNSDTLNGQWHALYAEDESKEITGDYYYHRALYKETARRQFHFAPYTPADEGRRIKLGGIQKGSDYFIDGGFLLSKTTARPIKTGDGFLIVHKDRVGNEGQIIVSSVTGTGKIKWSCTTGLKEWADWTVTPSKLIVTGTDNKKLSSGDINVLLIVDLASGKSVKHDYFKDK